MQFPTTYHCQIISHSSTVHGSFSIAGQGEEVSSTLIFYLQQLLRSCVHDDRFYLLLIYSMRSSPCSAIGSAEFHFHNYVVSVYLSPSGQPQAMAQARIRGDRPLILGVLLLLIATIT